eukprot:GDKK01041481.1.p1 GENE.GDKK01041481.1~~GDKK01041481.1.p1  ORF type:complete len:1002 (-),score=406.81 GDKK01041481.1:1120-4125(-)
MASIDFANDRKDTPTLNKGDGELTPNAKKSISVEKLELHAIDQFVNTKLCPLVVEGRSCDEDSCLFAHSEEELRPTPNLKKTRLCANFKKGSCSRGDACIYAHGDSELRHTDTYFKTKLCKYYAQQLCNMGNKCRHAHGIHELRPAPEFVIPKTIAPVKKKKSPVPYQSASFPYSGHSMLNKYNNSNNRSQHYLSDPLHFSSVGLPEVPLVDPSSLSSGNPLFLLPCDDSLNLLQPPPSIPRAFEDSSPLTGSNNAVMFGQINKYINIAAGRASDAAQSTNELLSSAKAIPLNPSASVFVPLEDGDRLIDTNATSETAASPAEEVATDENKADVPAAGENVDDGLPWSVEEIIRFAAESASDAAAAIEEARRLGLNQISFDEKIGRFVTGICESNKQIGCSSIIGDFRSRRSPKTYPHTMRKFLVSTLDKADEGGSIRDRKLRVLKKAEDSANGCLAIGAVNFTPSSGSLFKDDLRKNSVRVNNSRARRLQVTSNSTGSATNQDNRRYKRSNNSNNFVASVGNHRLPKIVEDNKEDADETVEIVDERPFEERFPSLDVLAALSNKNSNTNKKSKLNNISNSNKNNDSSASTAVETPSADPSKKVSSPAVDITTTSLEDVLPLVFKSKQTPHSCRKKKIKITPIQSAPRSVVPVLELRISPEEEVEIARRKKEEEDKNAAILERIHNEVLAKLALEESRAEQQRSATGKKEVEEKKKKEDEEVKPVVIVKNTEEEEKAAAAAAVAAAAEAAARLAEKEEKERKRREEERLKLEAEAAALKAKRDAERLQEDQERERKAEAARLKRLEDEKRAAERNRALQLERVEKERARKEREQEEKKKAAAEEEAKKKRQLEEQAAASEKKAVAEKKAKEAAEKKAKEAAEKSKVSAAASSSSVKQNAPATVVTPVATPAPVQAVSSTSLLKSNPAVGVPSYPSAASLSTVSKDSSARLHAASVSLSEGRLPSASKASASQLLGLASVGVGIFRGLTVQAASVFGVSDNE